jgi:hypothetical protein
LLRDELILFFLRNLQYAKKTRRTHNSSNATTIIIVLEVLTLAVEFSLLLAAEISVGVLDARTTGTPVGGNNTVGVLEGELGRLGVKVGDLGTLLGLKLGVSEKTGADGLLVGASLGTIGAPVGLAKVGSVGVTVGLAKVGSVGSVEGKSLGLKVVGDSVGSSDGDQV